MAMKNRILLIDDDPLVIRTLDQLLEREGYSVICAESGAEAVKLIENMTFDLIISDVKMPGMNGIETTEAIQDILKGKNEKSVPVIFITGYADEENYIQSQNMNAADFIYKPFDKIVLLQSIENVLKS